MLALSFEILLAEPSTIKNNSLFEKSVNKTCVNITPVWRRQTLLM